jgi:hypothetical protein
MYTSLIVYQFLVENLTHARFKDSPSKVVKIKVIGLKAWTWAQPYKTIGA